MNPFIYIAKRVFEQCMQHDSTGLTQVVSIAESSVLTVVLFESLIKRVWKKVSSQFREFCLKYIR